MSTNRNSIIPKKNTGLITVCCCTGHERLMT